MEESEERRVKRGEWKGEKREWGGERRGGERRVKKN